MGKTKEDFEIEMLLASSKENLHLGRLERLECLKRLEELERQLERLAKLLQFLREKSKK